MCPRSGVRHPCRLHNQPGHPQVKNTDQPSPRALGHLYSPPQKIRGPPQRKHPSQKTKPPSVQPVPLLTAPSNRPKKCHQRSHEPEPRINAQRDDLAHHLKAGREKGRGRKKCNSVPERNNHTGQQDRPPWAVDDSRNAVRHSRPIVTDAGGPIFGLLVEK